MPATLNQLQGFINQNKRSQTLSERFLGLLFERATSTLLECFTLSGLEALSKEAFAFLSEPAESEPPELKVRVYNPSAETHGWTVPYTVLELSLPDRPFIVDSVRAAVRRQGLEVAHLLHPILSVVRDASGDVTELYSAAEATEKPGDKRSPSSCFLSLRSKVKRPAVRSRQASGKPSPTYCWQRVTTAR